MDQIFHEMSVLKYREDFKGHLHYFFHRDISVQIKCFKDVP